MIEEAKKIYPLDNFFVTDMENIHSLKNKKYDLIFFIASFHHLEKYEQRLDTLEKATTMLHDN